MKRSAFSCPSATRIRRRRSSAEGRARSRVSPRCGPSLERLFSASTTSRPILDSSPVTSVSLQFGPSAILMRAPGSVRLFEELRESGGSLPRQALEQGRVEVDPVVEPGRVNLQTRPAPYANLAHEGVSELVGELGVLGVGLHLRLFHLVPRADLAHEGDCGLVAELGVLVFHVPFLQDSLVESSYGPSRGVL